MMVSHKQFNLLALVLAVLAVLMLPLWPYARWGYFPSGMLVVLVLVMFALQRLARE
jgi:hypothetical protein